MQLHNPHNRLAKRLLPRFSPTWMGSDPSATATGGGITLVGPPVGITQSTPSPPTPTPAAPPPDPQSTTSQQQSTSIPLTSSTQPLTSTSTTEVPTSSTEIASSTPTTTSTSVVPTTTAQPTIAHTTTPGTTLRVSPTVKAITSGGTVYTSIISAPEPTASEPANTTSVSPIVGAVAGALVGAVCLIAFISWLVRQHKKRKQNNHDDFDRQSYLRNSMMIPDDAPNSGRPVIGTQAALALARSNTGVAPRPPTMIERKPTYLMNGQPSSSYGPGQVVSFEPGQVVSAALSAGNGYPSPMAFAAYTPPAEHHQTELARRPSGATRLTRQPTNGGMYNQGYEQSSPVSYSPEGYQSPEGYTYPMHPPGGDRGTIQSVTPFQAQQYAEITRQLGGQHLESHPESFHPMSPSESSPVGYAVSDEAGMRSEKALPNPFDEKTSRVDSMPPSLPALGVDDGKLSRTGTPIDPNPQHAHWSYDAKASQPGTRLSVAGMPTIPPAAYTREEKTVVVGNGETHAPNRARPLSGVDEDDIYGGM